MFLYFFISYMFSHFYSLIVHGWYMFNYYTEFIFVSISPVVVCSYTCIDSMFISPNG